MAKQSYQWFLEPRNSHTNEVLSNALDGQENFYNNISCADGKRRNLWLCPSGLVFMFWRSRSNLKIRFRIFNRQGEKGKIRDCTFLFKNDSGGKRKKRRKRSPARL